MGKGIALPDAPAGYSELPPAPPGYSDFAQDLQDAEQAQSREQMTHKARSLFSNRDPGIDYVRGIKNFKFRIGFGRMKGEAEKENYLNINVGKGNWGKDSFGEYFIKPKGGREINEVFSKPTAIDEQTLSYRDIADMSSSAPAIAGGVAGSLAATGLGVLPAIGVAALGAMAGTAIDETVKNVQGLRRRSAKDIALDIAGEGALAATGEVGARAVSTVGRFAIGPGAGKMTPEKVKGMEDTVALGFKIKPGQITQGPILGRWEGMVKMILGDLNGPHNSVVAFAHYQKLLASASATMRSSGDMPIELANAIKVARKSFGDQATRLYAVVDDMAGQPIVPTVNFQKTLADLVDAMPKDAEGAAIFTSPQLKAFFKNYSELAEFQSLEAAQGLRTTLREAGEYNDLIPGIDTHRARLLERAVNADIKAIKADPAITMRLRRADNFWKEGIVKFDDHVLKTITRGSGKRGGIEPEMILEHIIKPKYADRIRRVKAVTPKETWDLVKRGEGERILEKAIKKSDNPLVSDVFDGLAFEKELDRLGRDVVTEVFGKEWTDQAFKLAKAIRIAESRQRQSGGIVAANIALHPVKNLPKLFFLKMLSKLMQTPQMLRYMTIGFQVPKTRAGADALTRISAQMLLLSDDKEGLVSDAVASAKDRATRAPSTIPVPTP